MLYSGRLGLAGGILWSVSVFITTLLGLYVDHYANHWIHMVMSIYPGYSVSWPGAFLGAIYGFIDGFVGLFLLAWLYNRLIPKKTNPPKGEVLGE
jgi:hypothetical protein